MSPRHRSYLLVEQGIGAGVVNLAINGLIAWLVFRGATAVPLWGDASIVGDTIVTTFLLPLISTLVVTRVVRGHVRSGRVPPLTRPQSLRWLPLGITGRGAMLGLACIVLAGIPTSIALGALGVTQMSVGGFVAFKALFAAVLATAVTPLIARLALADPA